MSVCTPSMPNAAFGQNIFLWHILEGILCEHINRFGVPHGKMLCIMISIMILKACMCVCVHLMSHLTINPHTRSMHTVVVKYSSLGIWTALLVGHLVNTHEICLRLDKITAALVVTLSFCNPTSFLQSWCCVLYDISLFDRYNIVMTLKLNSAT